MRIPRKPNNREYDEKYATFRYAVRKRDKNKCQMPGCGKKSKLQVHHILRWHDNPALRYEPTNGITLCKVCHKRVTGNESAYAMAFVEIVKRNNAG